MVVATNATARLFYSYSVHDESSRQELEKHLSVLRRSGAIDTWSFRQIEAGTEWESAIDVNLREADVILLLVSADFLASDYCWHIETKRALERHEAGEAVVVPIILRDCDWRAAPFAKLQALPEKAKPISRWRRRDTAWTTVVFGIRQLIEQRRAISLRPLHAEPSRVEVTDRGLFVHESSSTALKRPHRDRLSEAWR